MLYIPHAETENKKNSEMGDEQDHNARLTKMANEKFNFNALVKRVPGLANHTTGLYKEIQVNSMVKAKR